MQNSSLTALVTGSSSGIGKNIAFALAEEGYDVVFHGHDDLTKTTALECSQKYDRPFRWFVADLRHEEACTNLVCEILKEKKRLDIVVNNAGIQHVSPIQDFSSDKWNDILAVNLSSSFHIGKAVWTSMLENGFGRIVNVSSVHGLRASEYKAAYVSAKHGLIGLTKVMALEGANKGITANAICPGYVKTPLVEKQIIDQARSHGISESEVVEKVLLKKQPVKEFISPESISELVLTLCKKSSEAITGASFVLDGGWSVQ